MVVTINTCIILCNYESYVYYVPYNAFLEITQNSGIQDVLSRFDITIRFRFFFFNVILTSDVQGS